MVGSNGHIGTHEEMLLPVDRDFRQAETFFVTAALLVLKRKERKARWAWVSPGSADSERWESIAPIPFEAAESTSA